MKIYLPDIRQKPDQAFAYTFSDKIPDSFGLESGSGRLEVKANMRISGDKLFLEGKLTANYTANCGRCLKEFKRPLEVDFSDTFTLQEAPDSPESAATLAAEAANRLVVSGNYFYLEDYFRQLFLLAQGYRSLCREDCRGICPTCGADLNEGPCGCAPGEEIDPRLKVLKDLLPRS